ncbi:MAG: 1-acyl-sn-glycerol-3-phosphate acyltransferase [Deltaproteobacteria bacterium]|nr:MAG: 1-acyl-sn-glycerol-3-phosphate acyltransferase [Deltaproteobacteria bacterium]
MTMIRSLFLWAFFGIVNTLFWILFGILLTLFLASSRTIHFYCAVPWAKTILWGAGVKVQTRGLSNIDKQKTYIFIPNHLSFFDIFSLLAYLPVDFKFILKKELIRIPILGWSMKRAGYISIDRSSPAKARRTLEQAVDRIKRGTSLVMFAEGTRGYDGRLQPLKRGAFQLAMASGVSVVPVAIKGTREIMPKGSFTIGKGSIVIQLEKPIETITYTTQTMPDLIERVSGSITAMLEEPE